MNDEDNRTPSPLENRPVFQSEEPAPRKRDKRSLVVFFSFVAALLLLVGLNMK